MRHTLLIYYVNCCVCKRKDISYRHTIMQKHKELRHPMWLDFIAACSGLHIFVSFAMRLYRSACNKY